MSKNEIMTLSFAILGIVFLFSFFMPAVDYYGDLSGYQIIFSPAIIFALLPNTLVILTLFFHNQYSIIRKVINLLLVLISAGCYPLIDISHPYPMIDSLLPGYWLWLFTCLGIIMLSFLASNTDSRNKKLPIESATNLDEIKIK